MNSTTKKEKHIMLYSGLYKHRKGVGIVLNDRVSPSFLGFWPINERLLLCKLKGNPFDIVIIQAYAPTADSSEEEIEKFYDDLNMALKQTKSMDIIYVLGDFNAKVGRNVVSPVAGKFGLGTQNERGERLVNFCEQHSFTILNTYFQHPQRRLYTWISPGDVRRNQIDYILVKSRFRNSIRNCRTYPGADINSDHVPVVCKMKLKLKKVKRKKSEPKLDLLYLKNKDNAMQFQIEVKNRFTMLVEENEEQRGMEDSIADIKTLWNNFKTAITETQQKLLPRKERVAKKEWMTKEILDLMTKRKKAKGKPEYTELNEMVKRKCAEAKEAWADGKCREIEQLQAEYKSKEMFSKIKKFTKTDTNAGGCIKDTDNNILFESDAIIKRWTEYVEDLFDDQRGENPIGEFMNGPEILSSEVENALYKMSKGKASGIDDINAEVLQALGDFGISTLTKLCDEMYKCAYIPEDLKTSVFILLPKKQRAIDCSDFRTISLMCHTLKLLLTIILNRINEKINTEVGPEQTGFRKNSGTREGIFNLKIIVEKYIDVNKDVYACFIDYAKAFDSVKHGLLVQCMQNINIDPNDVAIIANLYWQQNTRVRVNNGLSHPVLIKKGVRQGCVLSPALFNLYTERIFGETEELPGVKVNGHNINNLRYADDTVLLAESEEDLQRIIDVVNRESKKYGLHMNVKKTKTCFF